MFVFFKIGLVAVHALEKSNQRVPVSNNFPPSEKLCRSLFSFWELIEKRTKCQDAIIFPSQQTFILLWRRFWMESRRAKALKEIPSQSRTKYHPEQKWNTISSHLQGLSEMFGHGLATRLKSFHLSIERQSLNEGLNQKCNAMVIVNCQTDLPPIFVHVIWESKSQYKIYLILTVWLSNNTTEY